jgi:hypothetical protein
MGVKIQARQIETTAGAIATINAGDAAVEGTGDGLSRRDHQHGVATGTPTGIVEIADAGTEGTGSDLARVDHTHPVGTPGAPVDITKAAAAAGTAVVPAREDHKHDVTTAAAIELTDSTNAEGTATTLSRSNHTHAHGNRSGGSLHAAATPSVAGFISAADKTKLDTLIDPNLRDPKDSVRLLTTSNVATLSGNQTVDGILTAPGERVGLFGQSTISQDGIYVTAGGAWSRAADFQVATGQAGAVIPVEEGVSNADSLFLITNDVGTDVVGTHDLVVLKIAAGTPRGAGAGLILNGNDLDVVANADGSLIINANDAQVGVLATDAQHGVRGGGTQHADAVASGADGFMTGADKQKLDDIDTAATATTPQQERVTTETITNSDVVLTDTLNNTPYSAASVILFFNGVAQIQGAGEDYTISGTSITWLASSGTAVNMKTTDDLVAYYVS